MVAIVKHKLLYSIRDLYDDSVVFEIDPVRREPMCQAVKCRRHRTNKLIGVGLGPAIFHLCDKHVELLR